MSIINSNGFVKSNNIKVFPCAYRGSYTTTIDGTDYINFFNPEACTTSEYNFVNSFHKLSNKKDSYVVDWTPSTNTEIHNGVLKFVINGYYFEIIDCDITDFFGTSNTPKSFYIKVNGNSSDNEVPSSILYSFNTSEASSLDSNNVENSLCLDYKDGTNYVFTGLKITTDIGSETYTGTLTPFACRYNEVDITSFTSNDYIGKYVLSNDNYVFVTAANIANLSITAKTTKCYVPEFFLNPSNLAVTSLLDCGAGKYSLQVLADIENSVNNSTTASGDYSVALGKDTTASGTASTSLGNKTEATGNFTLVGGYEAKAKANNSIAFGNHAETDTNAACSVALGNYTKATSENQVVIGKYNATDATQAFIIANGDTTRGIGANKFTVGYEGNVKALGTLDIAGTTVLRSSLNTKGNIVADTNDTTGSTNSNNNLILGKYETITVTSTDPDTGEETTSTVNVKSSGSISVYGQTPTSVSDKVFSVSNTGKTYIDDETNATTSDGALKVAGGVRIAKKLNVGETLDVAGNVILGGNSSTNIVNIKKEPDDNDVNVRITGTTRIDGTTNIWGALGIHSEAESTTKNHGAIVVAGGVGVGKNLNVGGDTNLNNKLIVKTSPATTETNVKVDGTLNVTGKTDIYSNVTVDSNKTTLAKSVEITDTTASTTTTTGALKVSGGVGVTGNVNIGGSVSIASGITSGGSLILSGGSATHSLTLGHSTASDNKSAGSISVYTTAGNTGFSVDDSGNAAVYSKLEVGISDTSKVTINSGAITTTGAIEADGEVSGTSITATETLSATSTTATHTIGAVSITNGAISGVTSISTGSATLTGELSVGEVLTARKCDVTHTIGNVGISGGVVGGVTDLTATGTIKAQAFNAISDLRKKTNIKDYTCNKSILDLPIKSFEYINDESHTNYIGCIAQDLQEICPELVNKDAEGFLSIQETKLVYLLLQEVKELKEKVTKLERR